MLDECEPGQDQGEETWYTDPHAIIVVNGKQLKGTIKSKSCTVITNNRSSNKNMCHHCENIEHLPSFRKRLFKRAFKASDSVGNREAGKINFSKLTMKERIEKMKSQAAQIRDLESKNLFLHSANIRQRIRVRSLRETVQEYAARGSVKAFAHKLELANKKGLLKNKQFMIDAIGTFAKNLHVCKQGKRYPTSQKLLYEALSYMGGPKIVCFYALNFEGPDVHTVFRWRQKNRRNISGQAKAEAFLVL